MWNFVFFWGRKKAFEMFDSVLVGYHNLTEDMFLIQDQIPMELFLIAHPFRKILKKNLYKLRFG